MDYLNLKNKKLCPVCTTRKDENALFCKKCTWYFPLQDTPQYLLELNRARHLYKMIGVFEKLYEHVNARHKDMKRIELNLAIFEKEVETLKEGR